MVPSVKKESTSKVEGLSKREVKKRINIRWNSGLFFQIGLIISMLFVFLVVESNLGFSEIAYNLPEKRELNEVALKNYVVEVIPVKQIDKPKEVVKERRPVRQVASTKFKPVDNISKQIEDKSPTTEIDQNTPIDKPMVITTEVKKPEAENMFSVENVPIFPGCENLSSNEERKQCLNEKINAFINRKFDINKFSDKYAGKKNRIDVQFTVDTKGEITNIKTRTPFEDLSNEAKRVIANLPKMTPGKHQNQLVDVIYSVPIMLNIEY
ncbi:MAG: energy transducer TonB [Flavobacteriaceae bacterium]